METSHLKPAQETHSDSYRHFKALFDAALDGVLILDDASRCVDANPAACELFGLPPQEMATRRLDDFALPGAQALVQQAWLTFLELGELKGEARVLRPDGETRDVEFSSKANFLPGRHLSIVRDITGRKQVQRALRQSEEHLRHVQRFQAIGRLAGGVAHDFNNLLTAIIGYTGMLLAGLSEQDPLRVHAEEIEKSAQRAASLTRQLLAFGRRQLMTPKVLALNTVVLEMEKMLRRLIGEHIELTTILTPEINFVKADPGQLEQVIMNLVVNARDAMPEGGKLTIETAHVELDQAYARRRAVVRAGSYVMLAVSDTGCGMDEETQSHLFEPFFTTKELGKGTGLGLSTVYGIVKQSSGYVWGYSEPGRGSTFKIYLPRLNETVDPVPTSEPVPVPRGSETILLAEDEDVVRRLVCQILRRNGYRVLEASCGAEALQICAGHGGVIDLMLTDVVMPGMSGPELARAALGQRPEMKVLYMSGYTEHATIRQGLLSPGSPFLQKPFTSALLGSKLREVLRDQEPIPQSPA